MAKASSSSLLFLLAALRARLASAGCTQSEPALCWMFGTRQHCQIRGVGDRVRAYPLMVAIGCPSDLINMTGGGTGPCNACEQMVKNGASAPQPYNLGINDTVYVPPNFDCEACLPETREAMSCRLGENWRYCSAETNPGLRDAMLNGCGDPMGQCTFWRSAIEEACPLPYNCPSEDRQALIAVVASCNEGDGPVCAATTSNFPGSSLLSRDELARFPDQFNSAPDGYNALRPAWVMNNIPERNIDLVGGVPTQPRSRAAQAIY